MARILWLLVFAAQFSTAQKAKNINKSGKVILSNLQAHIGYLADDKLEGRRTGSVGEKLAYEYISNQFASTGLQSKGDNGTYFQEFEVNEGKQINQPTKFAINGLAWWLKKIFSLLFSVPMPAWNCLLPLPCPKKVQHGFGILMNYCWKIKTILILI